MKETSYFAVIIYFLLIAYATNANAGDTLLLISAMDRRDPEAVHDLLLKGENPNQLYYEGNTPLLIAFESVGFTTDLRMRNSKTLETIAPLICAGADFEHKNNAGESARSIAQNIMPKGNLDYIINFAESTKYCLAKYSTLPESIKKAIRGELEAKQRGNDLRDKFLSQYKDSTERAFYNGYYMEATNLGSGLTTLESIRNKHPLGQVMFSLSLYHSLKNNPSVVRRFKSSIRDAVKNFRRIAEKEGPEAINLYGVLLSLDGQNKQAIEQYRIAAERGSEWGKINYAFYLMNAMDASNNNKKQAVGILQDASKLGLPIAQVLLSVCYEKGIGTDIDPEKSFYWIREAAMQGSKAAMGKMAKFYDMGFGTDKNTKRGQYWSEKLNLETKSKK